MTSAPMEPGPSRGDDKQDVPAGDLGVGGPAEDTGEDNGEDNGVGASTPPGYPEQVDPARGPAADCDAGLPRPATPQQD